MWDNALHNIFQYIITIVTVFERAMELSPSLALAKLAEIAASFSPDSVAMLADNIFNIGYGGGVSSGNSSVGSGNDAGSKALNNAVKGKGYEIDWNKGIKGTQEVISGTNVPKSFVMEGKFVNGNEVWVHGNATKHIGEFVKSANGSVLVENEIMYSFKNAVNEVLTKELQPGRNFFSNIGGWDIGIDANTGVIYHALMR